jgi:hypothetical protein
VAPTIQCVFIYIKSKQRRKEKEKKAGRMEGLYSKIAYDGGVV